MESSLLKDHEVGGFYVVEPLGDALVFLSGTPAWGLCILLLSDAS